MKKENKKKKTWSTRAAVFSALRRKFKAYDGYKQIRDEAKEEFFMPSKKNKLPMRRVHFKCAACGGKFPDSQICIDHIQPVIPKEGLLLRENGEPDYNEYIDRLFCAKENLQVLCDTCHSAKTAEESGERAKERAKRKPPKEKKKRGKG